MKSMDRRAGAPAWSEIFQASALRARAGVPGGGDGSQALQERQVEMHRTPEFRVRFHAHVSCAEGIRKP